jgi:hypothetical protein
MPALQVPTLQAHSPEFKPQSYQKKKKFYLEILDKILQTSFKDIAKIGNI